ncbi:MAG: hypothetical protein KC940_22340, partial [Candidatus Omnitrophica bacterium]|nr:hypothetical protein [Candidatus Omnitrophota bacterium]
KPTTNEGVIKTSGGGSIQIADEPWINSGRIEVATSSPFSTQFDRPFTQSATGTLSLDIGGTSAANIATVDVGGGVANLDGTLEINLVSDFDPSVGNSFVIMTYGSRSGTFSTEDLPPLDAGEAWMLNYNANDITLEVVSP